MTGEIEKNDDQRQAVTSVGNSWVICNSKSRPGLKYYFNTATGQTVWNLSPIEIEKAQRYTKGLPISEIEKCPEPTDPPMDTPTNLSKTPPAQAFKEQIINSQFPNQITSLFPVNLLNGVPGVSAINPNIWNNPPSNAGIAPAPQVIYVACQPPINFQPSQEYLQQLPTQFHNVYNAQEEFSQNSHTNFQNNVYNRGNKIFNSNKGNRINNNWGRSKFSQHVQQAHNKWNNNSLDLRQKLIRKRSKSQSCELNSHEDTFYHDTNANNENMVQMNMQEKSPSKYDLSTLKHLKVTQSTSNNWFIVVDIEIILHNFPFLNTITDPDQNCYLMVPDHVMTEIEQLASKADDVRVRRIYRFLSALTDSELAFRGENMDDVADNDTDKMLATCVELATRNNVILLSNDIKVYKYKKNNNNNNIHILTLNELKLLLNAPVKQAPRISKSPTLDIKIVVSNDKEFECIENNPSSRLTSERTDFVTPHDAKKKDDNIQNSSGSSSSKRTVGSNEVASEKCLDEIDRALIINRPKSNRNEKRLENTYLFNNEKKKEIKLSRCLSNQKNNPEASREIKQFRWRKQRRNAKTEMNVSKASVVPSNSHSPANINHEATTLVASKKTDSNLCEMSPKATESPVRTPSIDRSSVSSYYKRIERPNVTIEETSTSGVISNTTLDCESLNSNCEGKLKKTISVCDDINFEMFQVCGQAMEEVLRTRREEWVLRFVQIMEEVLREKLRDDPPFQSKDSPPWATDLPELARCVIKKYSDHFNVVDAANRLSFTLQRISDNKGNVSANIEPGQYMDMYSFGVYLVQSLKNVINDCEDLNAAEESLKKLLYDIHNANLDFSHNDTFVDELNERTVDATDPIHADEHSSQAFQLGDSRAEIHKKDHSERQSSGTEFYMLRSHNKKTPTKFVEPLQQQKTTSVEKTFFSSLELAKRLNMNNTSLVKKLDFQDTPSSAPISNIIAQPTPPVPPSPTTSQKSPGNQEVQSMSILETGDNINKEMFSGNDDIGTNTGDEKEIPSTAIEPRFVRQFTSISQFEEKLLNKQFTDYDEDDEEYADNSYDADNDFANVYYDEQGKKDAGVNELEDGEIADLEDGEIADLNNGEINDLNDVQVSDKAVKNTLNMEESLENAEIDNNKKFRSFINEFIGEIKESFEAVQKLCSEFVEEFKNSQESSAEMKLKLRAACAAMLNISNSLNSILDRESTRPENNIMLLLEKANLVDFVPNEELRLEYTDNISKCRDQAYNCYKIVSLIMKRAGILNVA